MLVSKSITETSVRPESIWRGGHLSASDDPELLPETNPGHASNIVPSELVYVWCSLEVYSKFQPRLLILSLYF